MNAKRNLIITTALALTFIICLLIYAASLVKDDTVDSVSTVATEGPNN